MMSSLRSALLWLMVLALAVLSLAQIALYRGESVNAAWIVTAAVSIYVLAYRFYSLYLAQRVLGLDARRLTPAHRHGDGLDFVPTHRVVLFGHHFAAIAGAGPLIGPVLAAQMGYLPGTLWIIAGAVMAGAVQDMLVLVASTRRDGRSLGDMVRTEMGPWVGGVVSVGILAIMVILIAVLALVVVKALAHSPWGTFTVMATIPIAVFMGLYLRYLRPGRIGEMSLIGVVLLVMSIVIGGRVAADPAWKVLFTFSGEHLALGLIGYGALASILPVWLLLAPRDYLSTFLKIGTILALAIGIVWVMPELKMPALTRFIDGSGPVFAGGLFPFLFIMIACGAVSGFHSLVSSGTTPKLLDNELDARPVAFGGMLAESFVAIMAMIAASVIEPGVYFALNSPAALIGTTVQDAATAIQHWGFVVTPEMLMQTAKDIGEDSILSRAGGAPTLAVGMASILSGFVGGKAMMAFWYHFAILFEALFILTTIDAGTRVGRFMIQDMLGSVYAPLRNTEGWTANIVATGLFVSAWGWFLYQGVIDPLGGINTLWPLFGIANQMLAALALMLAASLLFKAQRARYAWVAVLPACLLLVVTLSASWQKLFNGDPRIGFLAHANKFAWAATHGEVLAPAKSLAQMQQVIFNDRLNATLCVLFALVVLVMLFASVRAIIRALRSGRVESSETVPEFAPAASSAGA